VPLASLEMVVDVPLAGLSRSATRHRPVEGTLVLTMNNRIALSVSRGRPPWSIIAVLAVVFVAPAPAAETPTGISLLYQSDAAYDPATAQRLAQANPHDLL